MVEFSFVIAAIVAIGIVILAVIGLIAVSKCFSNSLRCFSNAPGTTRCPPGGGTNSGGGSTGGAGTTSGGSSTGGGGTTSGGSSTGGGGATSGGGSTGESKPLQNSIRTIEKATHVTIPTSTSDAGAALAKSAFVQRLRLQAGEVEAANQLTSGNVVVASERHAPTEVPNLAHVLRPFEGASLRSALPNPSTFANIPRSALVAFGRNLVEHRQRNLLHAAATISGRTTAPSNNGRLEQLVQTALVATQALEAGSQWSVGVMHLERLEMSPAGIERGELLATIPLAPMEETAVIQKEWSVTSKEFTSIVTDVLENISETGVTDTTELAQSVSSQIQHGNQFNITGTVQGGIPIISGSSTAGATVQDTATQSAAESRKQAASVTQKASSRVKQEHKTTISTTTVTGTSETTTRTLRNSSSTDPIRIDYFSLMRRWQVRLYRYGARLTYDLVIPEPGGSLRQAYADLDKLQAKLVPFAFPEPHASVSESNFQALADKYGAQVSPPPPLHQPDLFTHGNPPNTPDQGDGNGVTIFDLPPIQVPEGYWVTEMHLAFHYETHGNGHTGKFSIVGSSFGLQADQIDFPKDPTSDHLPDDLTDTRNGRFMLHASGSLVITCRLENTTNTSITVRAVVTRTDNSLAQWENDTWNTLYNAAQTQYFSQQQDIAANVAQIQERLNSVDTLTLRREENDEIMKGVLRFLLGPDFSFMPDVVINALKTSNPDIDRGVGFTGNALGLSGFDWATVSQHEEEIEFINQAIEWENVITFLYSYFWDYPPAWDFIRQIRHPDANRQAFLRAGSARVVLTIRRGWEEAWVRFAEGGFKNASIPDDDPKLTIAKEIAAYDDTNYPGIPPANPARQATRLEDSAYTTATEVVGPAGSPVTVNVDSSVGFVVGLPVWIGGSDDAARESQLMTGIPSPSSLTVSKLVNQHGDGVSAYVILQPGEKGVVIAEWYEYTPTSGTDIAVTSNLATIA